MSTNNESVSDVHSSVAYAKKAVLAGSVCAFVAAILNPFDVVKVRMQLPGNLWPEKNLPRGLFQLVKEEGLKGCARGVEATILRELFYSSFRMYVDIMLFPLGRNERSINTYTVIMLPPSSPGELMSRYSDCSTPKTSLSALLQSMRPDC